MGFLKALLAHERMLYTEYSGRIVGGYRVTLLKFIADVRLFYSIRTRISCKFERLPRMSFIAFSSALLQLPFS